MAARLLINYRSHVAIFSWKFLIPTAFIFIGNHLQNLIFSSKEDRVSNTSAKIGQLFKCGKNISKFHDANSYARGTTRNPSR